MNRRQAERITKLEAEKDHEHKRRKMAGPLRWEGVRFKGDESGNQDVLNAFVKDFLHRLHKVSTRELSANEHEG